MIILISVYFLSIPLAFYDFKSLKYFTFSPIRIKHGVMMSVKIKENITPKTIALDN